MATHLRLAPDAVKEGKRVQVVALCTLTGTLTVSDGTNEKPADFKIKLVPRKFGPVPVSQTELDEPLPFHYPLALAFGANRSADVWNSSPRDLDAPDRWLDPGVDENGTKGSVGLQQVKDPAGPFEGDWYVAAEHLKMDRDIILNSKLMPGGPVYEHNGGYRGDLALIVEAARQHERIHTKLAAHGAQELRVLPQLEESMGSDQEQLLKDTNKIIAAAEGALKDSSVHSKVLARMRAIYGNRTVTIRVPRSENLDEYTVWHAVLAEIGTQDDTP